MKELRMSDLMHVLEDLTSVRDAELIEGYQRYVNLVEAILTPAQLDTYAAFIQRSGAFRVFDLMSPDELAALTPEEAVVATTIMADATGTLENRRVAALLNQRGQHAAAPDLAPPHEDVVGA
jgi:hypothetical protein